MQNCRSPKWKRGYPVRWGQVRLYCNQEIARWPKSTTEDTELTKLTDQRAVSLDLSASGIGMHVGMHRESVR